MLYLNKKRQALKRSFYSSIDNLKKNNSLENMNKVQGVSNCELNYRVSCYIIMKKMHFARNFSLSIFKF